MRRYHQGLFFVSLLMMLGGFSSPAHAGATAWIDIEVVDGLLWIESEVGGLPGRSIIDTGASVTAINEQFVKSSGLSFKEGRDTTIVGAVSQEERPTFLDVDTVMFETPLKFAKVVDLNLGPPEIQLLLGANFLDGYVIQFDYPNERMRLISRDSINLKKLKNIKSKKGRDTDGVLVRLALDGNKKSWLLLDTGASMGLVVSRRIAHRMDWAGKYQTQESRTVGVNSETTMQNFRVPSVQIGPYSVENVLVSIPQADDEMKLFERNQASTSRLNRRNEMDGVLGYDVLKHFVVTVDYGKGYVHLGPSEKVTED